MHMKACNGTSYLEVVLGDAGRGVYRLSHCCLCCTVPMNMIKLVWPLRLSKRMPIFGHCKQNWGNEYYWTTTGSNYTPSLCPLCWIKRACQFGWDSSLKAARRCSVMKFGPATLGATKQASSEVSLDARIHCEGCAAFNPACSKVYG